MQRSRYHLPLGRFAHISAILSTAVLLGVASHSTPDITSVIAMERVAAAVENAPAIEGFDHLGEQAAESRKRPHARKLVSPNGRRGL